MSSTMDLKKLSFLVYGLGVTGRSVIKFFKKKNLKNFYVWDDNKKSSFKEKRPLNLNKCIKEVDFIILSPGVSLLTSKYRNQLTKFKKKIITDLDLIFLFKKNFKSIVVTGTNGKSTTCKIIKHVLKKNNFRSLLGGNIGTPVLELNPKKNNFLIIEASSFQLSYSKFINPDYSILLNITNDHLDWHGNMKSYINAKFKIFQLQNKNQFSLLNKKFEKNFKSRKLLGKLIIPKFKNYKKIKFKIKNSYLNNSMNDENMSNIFQLSKLLKIKTKSFVNCLSTFRGLPHRYEIFLKKKNFIFINDSKATSFEATKFALQNSKNIFWIFGGLPKKKDKFILKNVKKNIIKSYIIGKNINFFKRQVKNKLNFSIARNLKNSLIEIIEDAKKHKKNEVCTILLSPAAASYDQFENFEKRGEEFKQLSRNYARKYL